MKLNGPPSDIHPALRQPAASSAALTHLAQAHHALAEATESDAPHERYVAAHRAALHTAAAVLAVRGRPEGSERGRRRIRSAWELLREASPELSEWSAYFASGASRRALAEAGVQEAVGTRQADELLYAAQEFRLLVERTLTSDSPLPHPRTAADPGLRRTS